MLRNVHVFIKTRHTTSVHGSLSYHLTIVELRMTHVEGQVYPICLPSRMSDPLCPKWISLYVSELI
jgi:hypothetical protein